MTISQKGGVYRIVNVAQPEKFYIGSTHDLDNRYRGHFQALERGKHTNSLLQYAWYCFPGMLTFEPLVICGTIEARLIEQRLLNQFRPYYNLSSVAGGTRHKKSVCILCNEPGLAVVNSGKSVVCRSCSSTWTNAPIASLIDAATLEG